MTITLEKHGGVGVVTMNDGKANIFNPQSVDALNSVLDQIEADEAITSVVITGMPGKFSAGFDLKYFANATPEDALALVDTGGRVAHRVFNLGKPTIAAITGHAIAMGVFLALACDRRIDIRGDFLVGANETVNGMVVPRFAMELVKFRLKPNFLDEAVIGAKLYSPDEAVEVGYFDAVTTPEALMPTVMQTAETLGALPGHAYAGNKRLVREIPLAKMAESLGLTG